MSAWKVFPFTEVISDESAGNAKIPKSEFQDSGRFPIVDQGQALIAGYTDDETKVCKTPSPIIVFGDHTRCFKYIDFPFCIGADGVKVLRPKVDADIKYLYHYLRQLQLTDAGYSRHFKYLKRAEIPLPPLPEQKRIAAILDKADALCTKRQAALAKLDELTQSIFLEMFGDPKANPKGWPIRKVSDYVAKFVGGRSISSAADDSADTKNRILKISAVTSLHFLPSESKPVPNSHAPSADHYVQPGDLLFSRANTSELVGAVAYVETTPPNLLLPDKLWRFVWKRPDIVEPYFVRALFHTSHIRHEIGRRATGTSGSMKNISQAKLMQMQTIVPPISMQREFAERILRIEHIAGTKKDSEDKLSRLFVSLQQRAFSGTL